MPGGDADPNHRGTAETIDGATKPGPVMKGKVTFQGLTLTRQTEPSGAANASTWLDATFTGNSATGDGGAVKVDGAPRSSPQ